MLYFKIMSNLEKICQRIIEYSFSALFILVPLILTPWNYELFEFNKMLTVYILTAIIVGAWLAKMVFQRQIIFRRTFWDIPLGLFFISQLTSFLLSIDRHTSFWGYYSRFNGGLLSIICYLLSYWAFVSNMNKHTGLITLHSSLITAALVALYGIAEHFGIDAKYWVQDVKNRVFSTLGQPNWLAAWLVALAPLTWSFALIANIKNQKEKIQSRYFKFNMYIYYLLFTIYYLCLLFTRSRSGLLGFGVDFLVFWGLAFLIFRQDWKKILQPFFLFTFSFFLLTFAFGNDWVPGVKQISSLTKKRICVILSNCQQQQLTTNTQQSIINSQQPTSLLISESGDIRKVVWKGAVEIWRHYPFLGTGPETFAYSYYWYRPREHNDLSEWDFLYNKAHNEYLNYAATTGSIGLLAYLLLIGSFLFWSVKKFKVQSSKFKMKNKNSKLNKEKFLNLNYHFEICILHFALFSGFLSIVVTNFFGFSVVPVQLLFFLFPAFAVSLEKIPQNAPKKSNAISPPKWQISLIIFAILYFIFYIFKYWRADTYFSSGEKLNKAGYYDQAFNSLQQAIKLRSFEPIYHDELAWSAANLAILTKEQGATLSGQFAELSLKESDKALKTSPYNLNFWKTKAKIGFKLATLEAKYYQIALQALLRGAELAPTDPKIKYNLALVYLTLGQNELATKTLEETVQLKPNYEDPRYALALIYKQAGEKPKAKEQLEYILKNINPQSEKAKEKLREFKN